MAYLVQALSIVRFASSSGGVATEVVRERDLAREELGKVNLAYATLKTTQNSTGEAKRGVKSLHASNSNLRMKLVSFQMKVEGMEEEKKTLGRELMESHVKVR